ncbi:hypothetical protein DPMN_179713 [Dreissena polymorpha]|uniref:Uncharacterized protein n=1 Tax=Dreissena polymorpha TaxID=45954 RepID=A0A9D4EFA0_DREPO|nr:hypothetical protein DPMN_179713 [Dreissena polymorpha]
MYFMKRNHSNCRGSSGSESDLNLNPKKQTKTRGPSGAKTSDLHDLSDLVGNSFAVLYESDSGENSIETFIDTCNVQTCINVENIAFSDMKGNKKSPKTGQAMASHEPSPTTRVSGTESNSHMWNGSDSDKLKIIMDTVVDIKKN